MSDAPPPPDHTQDSHVPIFNGNATTLSAKQYLVEVAWSAVNQMEWDDFIMEVTENRHGEQSGGKCPGKLKTPPGTQGGTESDCPKDHKALLDKRTKYLQTKSDAALAAAGNPTDPKEQAKIRAQTLEKLKNAGDMGWFTDFHSWCGDFTSWVFWKAWVLKGSPDATKSVLADIFNRDSLTGKWVPGDNLNKVERYAKKDGNGYLVWHPKGDKYVPQAGDFWESNRGNGGHIGVVAQVDQSKDLIITLDGKSFDTATSDGWNAAAKSAADGGDKTVGAQLGQGERRQGVARSNRTLSTLDLRVFIDTSALRKALGYL